MIEEPTLLAAQNLVFEKIGRNVVNFQKLERLLKYILKVVSLTEPKPLSQFEAHIQTRAAWLRTRPMGELVKHATEAFQTSPGEPPVEIREPWVSISMTFEGENWGVPQWSEYMSRVVDERNRLVHHILESFDIGTVDGCRTLCVELDAQRERTLPAFNQLLSMVSGFNMLGQAIAQQGDVIVEESMKQKSPHDA